MLSNSRREVRKKPAKSSRSSKPKLTAWSKPPVVAVADAQQDWLCPFHEDAMALRPEELETLCRSCSFMPLCGRPDPT